MDSVETWLSPTGRVLDVGCGTGRHLEVLAARGFSVTGLDRSRALLDHARESGILPGRLVRGDMRRLPYADGTFASLISMFTSFGYFGTRSAHVNLLREFARVVVPGGRMVLDYLNEPVVRGGIVPESTRSLDGYSIEEARSIRPLGDGDAVVKRVTIRTAEGNVVERYEEEVALYPRTDLLEMMRSTGWHPRESRGDYDRATWSEESPRLIVLAERGPAQ